MNTNKLADYLNKYALARSVPEQKYIEQAATMLRQQQAEIEKVNAEWVQAAMSLGRCVQENHDLKAEIAILRKAQEK